MYPLLLTIAGILSGVSAPTANTACNPARFKCDVDDCRSLAVYVLSRGQGVPDDAYQAYQSAKSQLEKLRDQNRISQLTEIRLGIEGERKLCALFADPEDARAFCVAACTEFGEVPLINFNVERCDHR